jgi:hypothetical protein
VTFSRSFFDLQIRFAQKVSALAGIPLEQALLGHTNLYIRLGLGRAFDANHPVWNDFLVGFQAAQDRAGWTHHFFVSRGTPPETPGLVARSGCFSYARDICGRLRLHFENIDPPDRPPLGDERVAARQAELQKLFARSHRCEPENARLAGVSWLYNLPAYRRLFPQSYLASAAVAPDRFRNMPLWGQFLDRHGGVRPAPATEFLSRLARQRDMSNLASCFPLQALAVEAPLADFWLFHGIAG